MVVLAIIGILAGMAVGGFGGIAAKDRVKGGVDSIQSFLERVSAETRKTGTMHGVKYAAGSFTAYSDSNCTVALFVEPLAQDVSIVAHGKGIAGPSIATGLTINGWSSSGCVKFRPQLSLNPVDTVGFFEFQHSTRTSYHAIVYKIPSDNRFLVAFSTDGGATWTAK